MKIDRLLSIVMYLLNRDLVSARELAERFEVSVRTIQRDMDALCSSGIPITSIQGPAGGFGIIEGYKLDRQLVDTDDLFFILTALEGIGTTLQKKEIISTLEKVKTLVHDSQAKEIEQRKEKLLIDFSEISLAKNNCELFYLLEQAIENNNLVSFTYTGGNYKVTERTVEPMTVVFKWYSWYLFAFCRLKNDYRLFRLSRMRDVVLERENFDRRDKNFCDFSKEYYRISFIDLVLKFDSSLKVQVEDYFRTGKLEYDEHDNITVHIRFPEDEWLYGLILSYGDKVEVLQPAYMRDIILKRSQGIVKKYQKN
ncbi:YafY family transcriptional regulator [candidate division KSB1 bacterium]|nr:YafY family transcriptional regulator [candidate division KSB1 bacterium]